MLFNRFREISREMQSSKDEDKNPDTDWETSFFGAEPKIPSERVVQILYVNHKGISEPRNVVPDRIWYGTTEWFAEKQWLMDVFDVDRRVFRTLAFSRIVNNSHTDGRVFAGSSAQGAFERLRV